MRQSYRSNEEFRVDGSEQCGGLYAPESGISVAFFTKTLVAFIRVFIRHVRKIVQQCRLREILRSKFKR